MNAQIDIPLDRRIEALANGHCSEDDFLTEIFAACDSGALSPWKVVSSIDECCRRGQMTTAISRSVQGRIAQRALEAPFQTDTFSITAQGRVRVPDGEEPDSSLRWSDSLAPIAAVGQVFKQRYTLMEIVGAGRRNVLYRATDHLFGLDSPVSRTVAVKILRGSAVPSSERLAVLRNEFLCAQALSHPNIITVYDLYCDPDIACYTMEWLDGVSLGQVLKNPASLSRNDVWAITSALGAALEHAHSRQIVHGDLKPQNVMIARDGAPRLLDFGCARYGDGSQSVVMNSAAGASVTLTPAYASCEMLAGQAAQPSDDLYALASVTYQMLTGRLPFGEMCATDARSRGMRPLRPAGLTTAQWKSLQRALAWTRADRGSDVAVWLKDMGLNVQRSGWLPVASAQWLRRPLAAAMAAGLVLTAGVTAYVARQGAQPVQITHAPANSSIADPARTPVPAATAPTPAPTLTAALPAAVTPASAQVTRPNAATAVLPTTPATPRPPVAPRHALTIARARAAAPSFTARRFVARRNAGFVQINIVRRKLTDDSSPVTWWTEDATARAGIDFLPQEPAPRAFAEGRRRASLIVKLPDNSVRTTTSEFRVCLALPAADGASPGSRCTIVILPPAVR